MKKTIYTLFLFLVCLATFCLPVQKTQAENTDIFEPNAFRICRQAGIQDKIALSYIFPLNSNLMKKNGFSENEIKTYRFYLTTYVNALAQANKKNEFEGVEVGNCAYFEDVDGLGFSILFDNLQVQKKFFGMEDSDKEEKAQDKKSTGFFVRKLEIKTTFPVSSAKVAGDLKMICTMAISSWSKDNSVSVERKQVVLDFLKDSVFIYDFASTEKNLKSSLMYDDKIFHHNVFVKTLAEVQENNTIVFWTTYINRPMWYLMALIFVLVGMFVAFVCVKAKKKSNKISKN